VEYSAHGNKMTYKELWSGSLKEIDHLEDVCVLVN
jgi:hypothetical protein